ncbi:MAG: hypothetical protein JJ713_08640 [Acidithiobacillus sp.]|uniref:hypothetical protein n=1 Tax=Acidithiobacillus sp. TaxID=1872118 RepID=UPI0025873D7B|nr:hypothetical protein [Acidithiobacillus sp.]MCE5420827.1 hypothetical protein [Acidithiobacillus sp.]
MGRRHCWAALPLLVAGMVSMTQASVYIASATQNDPAQLALQSAINEQRLQLNQMELDQQESALQQEQRREAQRLKDNQLQIQQEAIQQQLRAQAAQSSPPQP